MNNYSDPVHKRFTYGWLGRQCPNLFFSKRLEMSETKLIFGLQVNIDKANSCRYDVTR